jgi:(p)ppGpp synthase/HD superfamily hydrolase
MPQRSEVSSLSIRYTAALQLAFEVHGHQLRKGTSISYLAHVMSVSALVLEAGGDEDCAIAGLLHDAVEDSDDGAAMLHRIRGQFGDRVATIVNACSDAIAVPGQLKAPWLQRKRAYISHLGSADADSLLVSACDKLHNARSIVGDMREIGAELFQRFSTKSGADQIWYYQALCDVFETRVRPTLFPTLREVVVEMTNLGNDLGIATEEECAWVSRVRTPRSLPFPISANQTAMTIILEDS